MFTNIIIPNEGGIESCTIVSWNMKQGDIVEFGDVVCEVETDKMTFEIESPIEGVLHEILFEEGDTAPVLKPIAVVKSEGDDEEEAEKPLVQNQPQIDDSELKTQEETIDCAPKSNAQVLKKTTGINASPKAKMLANKLGIDISTVVPGSDGVIRAKQVQLYAGEQSPGMQPAQNIKLPENCKEVPVTNVRKATAVNMYASLQNTAQLTLHTTAKSERMTRLIKGARGMDLHVSVTDAIVFALSRTLKNHRYMNAFFSEGRMYEYDDINVGIAVDTPHGLFVPVIKNADSKTMNEISLELKELAGRAREKKIAPADISQGTFTVSNLGSLGIMQFTPVVNIPQAAILGVTAIRPELRKDELGNICETEVIGFSLTIDHRAVDGAPASRFLKDLCYNIENIDLLLAR